MAYLKKQLDAIDRDEMRITLSAQISKLSSEPVCDFCGNGHPVAVYASARMSTGETKKCWRWTACDICEMLIDSSQWGLIEKQIEHRLIQLYESIGRPVPDNLIHFAVKGALEEFHRFAIGV